MKEIKKGKKGNISVLRNGTGEGLVYIIGRA